MKGKVLVKGLVLVICLFMLSVPSAMAQEPCTADFNCNGTVAAEDVDVFLSQFGRSPFNNPCPDCYDSPCPCTVCPPGQVDCGGTCVDTDTDEDNCGSCSTLCPGGDVCVAGGCEISCSDNYAPVAKTGQTTSYVTGDDGDLGRGVAGPNPRFTDNLDGTITDSFTGLIWLKNANCFDLRNWDNALSDSNGLADAACGLTDGSVAGDWRLPNRFELESLLDLEYYNPAVPNTAGTGQWSAGDPFDNVQSNLYWSSTTYASASTLAWGVSMPTGTVYYSYKTTNNSVWPVRGGQ